jgi:uncharacterized protein (DUF1015 family)
MRIKAFKGLRPRPDLVRAIASRPYDVLDSDEAREEAEGNPLSFLNVVKPEITLPRGIDPHAEEVYQAGNRNFRKLVEDGVFRQDDAECLYLYELTMNGQAQTGIVACAWVEDYLQGRIKKHELTRPDKEEDRKQHIRYSMLNAEPVFFAYRAAASLDNIASSIKLGRPVYDFQTGDGVGHRFWVVVDTSIIDTLIAEFERLTATYVADGHHRTAAAALVGRDLSRENPRHTGAEEYNYFLAVHFPDTQLRIMDYNRVVKDLNGLSHPDFIAAVSQSFEVKSMGAQSYKPRQLHEFGLYLAGNWYALRAKPGTYDDTDPLGVLDVTILSERILAPVLNITDLRRDKRIDFVGGIRGLQELERRVDSGAMAAAFAMHPVSMQQLMAIADSGNIMPPKTTWFEPKLRSGLVVHSLWPTAPPIPPPATIHSG